MSRATRRLTKTRVAVGVATLLTGALFALSACAAEPEAQPSASPTTTSTPEPYAGPLTFAGDELGWFALTAEEIADLLPAAAPAGALTPNLLQYSDGGGPEFTPAACVLLISETSMRSVAARTVPWVDEGDGGNSGRQEILQLGSVEQATQRMDQLAATVDQCAQFDADGPGTFEAVSVPESEGVRAFGGTLVMESHGSIWRAHHAFASVGNVLVHLWQPALEGSEFDAERAAVLLRDRALAAKTALIEELTAKPPVSETPAPADPTAPWSAWQMSGAAVGPLSIGAERDAVLAAVPGARVEPTEWSDAEVRIFSADGAASLLLHFTEDGKILEAVTAGIANMAGDTEPDGAALPAVGAVRIGAGLAEVTAAFPGGTYMRIVSSGEFFYQTANRAGEVVRFRLDRDFVEDGAVVTGVTVEDSTLTGPLVVD